MGVIVAGQVGVIGHLNIGDGVRIGAQSGRGAPTSSPARPCPASPARNHADWLRTVAALQYLPEMRRELRRLAQGSSSGSRLTGEGNMSEKTTNPAEAAGRTILIDIEAIQRILPHRPPFLLVDRVVEHEQGKRLVA